MEPRQVVVVDGLEETMKKLVEASVDTGVADDISVVGQLDDSSKSWPVDAFENLIVEITGGTGEGQIRKIGSNTATSLTPVTDFDTAPDATSQYRIGFFGKMASDITAIGGTVQTGDDWTPLLQNLDLALTALRDALQGGSSKDFTTLETDLESLISALKSVDTDELIARITDSGGTEIDPATESSLTSEQPRKLNAHAQSDITVHASAAETVDGSTADVDLANYYGAELALDITSVSGTNPSMDLYIEGKDSISGKYKTLDSFTGLTATGTHWTTITDLVFRYIRARWGITGTSPSFTFSHGGSAKV